MATYEIPVNPGLPSQVMTIPLDGVRYILRFYFCFREGRWMMDLRTDKQVALIEGVTIISDWPLLQQFVMGGRPSGEFLATDTSGKGIPPGWGEFGLGKRVKMQYVEA